MPLLETGCLLDESDMLLGKLDILAVALLLKPEDALVAGLKPFLQPVLRTIDGLKETPRSLSWSDTYSWPNLGCSTK